MRLPCPTCELPRILLLIAHAHNRVTLDQAGQQWPEPQVYKGREVMAGKIWFRKDAVGTTTVPNLRHLSRFSVTGSARKLYPATGSGLICFSRRTCSMLTFLPGMTAVYHKSISGLYYT